MDRTSGDRFSSPESSNKDAKEHEMASLCIRKQPPSHVFAEEPFDIEFSIEAARGSSDSPPTNVTIYPEVVEAEPIEGSSSSITILEEPRISSSRRSGRVRVRVSSDRETVVKVRLSSKEQLVNSVYTREIRLVRYKIRVLASDSWSSVWYKDEGGRDKSMEVNVGLFDASGTRVNEKLPLKLVLCYYGETDEHFEVSKQDIFRTLGKLESYKLDGGKARIRFRIEDVSKNHQGQNFCLKVGTDTSYVAPGYSPAVSVRSKRNKRQRTGSTASRSNADYTQRNTPTAYNSSSAPQRQGLYSESQSMSQHPPNPTRGVPDGPEQDLLREAVNGVSQWVEEVVNGLYPLQWQVLGYAQYADGSPDYNRPYHNMPNPNPLISRVLNIYSDSTRAQLRLLQDYITRGSTQSTSATSQSSTESGGPSAMSSSMNPQPPFSGYDPFGQVMRTGPGGPVPMHPPHPQMPPQHHSQMGQLLHTSRTYPYSGPDGRPLVDHQAQGPADASDAAYQSYQAQGFPSRPTGQPQASTASFPPRYDDSSDPLPVQMPARDVSSTKAATTDSDTEIAAAPGVASAGPSSTNVETNSPSQPDDVEYVLAKQYKSLRTGERLGFPAYSARKELLGFFRESSSKVGHAFFPISNNEKDLDEIKLQAGAALRDAIDSKSEAVHALRDWGSISNLVDHALVYDWSKDIGPSSNSNNCNDTSM